MKPFHTLNCSAIMESVSGFSSCFPPRNLEGSLSPESGTGCIGLSTALSEQPPRGTDRRDRSIALSRRPPQRDTFAAAKALPASAPRTPWSRCTLRTGRILTSSQLFRRSSTTDWAASSLTPAFHSRAACGIGTATPDQPSQMASKFKHMKEVLKEWKHYGLIILAKEVTCTWNRR